MGLVVECANAKLMSKVDVATDVSEVTSLCMKPTAKAALNASVMVCPRLFFNAIDQAYFV